MKLIYKLIFFSIFFYANNLSGQTYQPFPTDSAEWRVDRCFYFFLGGWYDDYSITMDGTDTIYQGLTYKKLYITQHLVHGIFDSIYPVEFFGGMREINKKVYIYQKWATVDTTAHLVYDFNSTNIGDTIYTSCLAASSSILLGHKVISTDSVLVGAQFHKRLSLQDINNSFNTEYWIEGVGSSWGLPFATFWSITDNSYDLICYDSKPNLHYQNSSPTFGYCLPPLPPITCSSIPTNTNIINENNNIVLFPNPAKNLLSINLNQLDMTKIEVLIYSVTGQLIKTLDLVEKSSQIDITTLKDGLYFIVFKSENLIQSHKLIIER